MSARARNPDGTGEGLAPPGSVAALPFSDAPLAPWQQRIYLRVVTALEAQQLGHALLLGGAPAMGKREVARRLAMRLLCAKPGADGFACGECRGCRLFRAGTHPDLHEISFGLAQTGNFRSEIIVDQVRALAEWFSLTPQAGGAQVAIVCPAEAMNTAAANALLKTLEEPSRDRYLILVSDQPGRLAATIRSRCQKLEFRIPLRAEAEAWLRAAGFADPGPALDAARGHPGVAADWLANDALALRADVLAALNALAGGRRSPVELAAAWLADPRAGLRLRFAAELVHDAVAHQLAGRKAPGLTMPGDFQKLGDWYDRLNRLREQLPAPALRHDLVLAGLLLEWRGYFEESAGGAGR
ncbi:DNA polymerase III subunit delta' [Arenimonas composti]|nr:DNA polymerase III subunit delta' [Arenimonas composti]